MATGSRSVREAEAPWTHEQARSLNGFQQSPAHRYAYELWVGPIPAGHSTDHLCHNTLCVNPAHMEPVTPAQNLARRLTVGRTPLWLTRETCFRGHPWTPENTYKIGNRIRCRVCANEYKRGKKSVA